MAETWNKRERELKKRNAKKQKAEKKLERKGNSTKGKGFEDMLAYVDENGDLSSTPPDKSVKINNKVPVNVANSNALNPDKHKKTGIVTFFDAMKGYGFIRDTRTQESVFVHMNSSSVELRLNLKVDFEVEKGVKGLAAVNVTQAK